jgi:hypothetical protein
LGLLNPIPGKPWKTKWRNNFGRFDFQMKILKLKKRETGNEVEGVLNSAQSELEVTRAKPPYKFMGKKIISDQQRISLVGDL